MRAMCKLISDVGKQSMETIKDQMNITGQIFEMKELLMKFTVDVIATCAFGLEINSFDNPSNDIQRLARKATDFTKSWMLFKFLGYMMIPKIMSFFNIKIFDKEVTDFFQTAIIDVMKGREAKGIVRLDMINLLMEAHKGKLSHSNEENMEDGFATAQESDLGKIKVDRKWNEIELAALIFLCWI